MSGWLAWQIVDSAFPTGAFAHSWGLEAAWQHGEVQGPDGVQAFLRASILQAGYAVLPLVNEVYRSGHRLEELDTLADAFLTNVVANRASRVQGRTLVSTVQRIWPLPAVSRLQRRSANTCCHVAPVTGAAFHAMGLPLVTVQRVVLFGTARSVLSAAVRLGAIGSYEAQRFQFECGDWLDRVLDRCAELTDADLAQTAPIIDLLQSAHDRLYSRLFQS